LEKLLMGK